jgi:hypothetical protein
MAGSKSDYAEAKVLDHLTGKASFTMPTAYVGLYTATPSDAGGGTEVSGGSYARVETAGTDWAAASGGATSNAAAITFPEATANWGTVKQFGLFDDASAGNLLYWGDLTASKPIYTGDTASFAIGEIDITED